MSSSADLPYHQFPKHCTVLQLRPSTAYCCQKSQIVVFCLADLDSCYQDEQLSSKPLSLGRPLQLHMSSSSRPQLPWSLTEYRQVGEKKQENSRNDQKLHSHKSANHNKAYRTQRKSANKRAVSAKLCSLFKLLARLQDSQAEFYRWILILKQNKPN